MECRQAKRQIPAYRAGALDCADRRALECHLSGCEGCAAFFAQGEALLRQAAPASDECPAPAVGMER